jgi:hypothetical protein
MVDRVRHPEYVRSMYYVWPRRRCSAVWLIAKEVAVYAGTSIELSVCLEGRRKDLSRYWSSLRVHELMLLLAHLPPHLARNVSGVPQQYDVH